MKGSFSKYCVSIPTLGVSKLQPTGQMRPNIQLLLASIKFRRCSCISHVSVYIVNFLQALKKFLIMISAKHSVSATIESNVIDIVYVDEIEIHTVLTYHCATYTVWPGPFLVVLYLALNAKSLDTPALRVCNDPLCKGRVFTVYFKCFHVLLLSTEVMTL